jgi:hypothetical protein
MMVIAPLMLTGLIFFAFGGMGSEAGDLPAVTVGIVNLDFLPQDAPLDVSLGESIRSMFFDESVKSWISAVDYADEAAARQAVDRQETGMAVIIPATFTADILSGEQTAPILLIQDPTLTITPLVVRNMLTSFLDGVAGGGIAYQTVLQRQQANGLAPDPAHVPVLLEKYAAWYQNFQRDLFHDPQKAALAFRPLAGESDKSTSWITDLIRVVMAGQMIFFAFFSGSYAMMSIL